METSKNGSFVVKRYAVREAEKWRYAVHKAKIGRYAVRKGGGGVTLIIISIPSERITSDIVYIVNVIQFID